MVTSDNISGSIEASSIGKTFLEFLRLDGIDKLRVSKLHPGEDDVPREQAAERRTARAFLRNCGNLVEKCGLGIFPQPFRQHGENCTIHAVEANTRARWFVIG